MKTVFIDGKAGTTGLQIFQRLEQRDDVALLQLSEEERKDPAARKKALNSCDIAFLCLPDDAARESVSLVENDNVVIIDASTAHRTAPGWAYGFPELGEDFFSNVSHGNRIAVPGCHASGFVALIQPLVRAGILSPKARLCATSVTGYSGGGKKMIAEYEDPERDEKYGAPRQYALGQTHKHLPEMQKIPGLEFAPAFSPIVSGFYSGMVVSIPVFAQDLLSGAGIEDVRRVYRELYTGPMVTYEETLEDGGFLAGNCMTGMDTMKVSAAGNSERILLTAAFDNLGKGASGAAVECLNIKLGAPLTKGLKV